MYQLILRSLKDSEQVIVLAEYTSKQAVLESQSRWRKVLGGKNWTVNRRPGLDTLNHLALTTRRKENETD